MNLVYCPECGNRLIEKETNNTKYIKFCYNCQKKFYNSPKPCIIVSVVNEFDQVLLIKSNYISTYKWTLIAGYVEKEETLEQAAIREVLEETGQMVKKLEYIKSYYFKAENLVMPGFIAFVKKKNFNNSNEVDDLFWCDISNVEKYINRENNMSGIHFDSCKDYINNSIKSN